jgi:hypothetical protein
MEYNGIMLQTFLRGGPQIKESFLDMEVVGIKAYISHQPSH